MLARFLKISDPPSISGIWSEQKSFQYALKRPMDVILALILLILFSPLMAVIALLIRLDSPGPIIFKQIRVKQKSDHPNNDKEAAEPETFTFYKFRSMRE